MNGDTPLDGRLLVLESDSRRHDDELKELGKRVSAVESDTHGIPRIEKTMEDVLAQLKILNDCRIASEAEAKSKISWWETPWGQRLWDIIRAVALVVATLLFAMNQHLMGVK